MTELDLQHNNTPAGGDNAELLKTYRETLAGHDWYYMMSDDHSVYKQGARVRTQLARLREALDPDAEIWNQYAKPEFKINPK